MKKVSIIALIWAHIQVKLLTGLISTSSLVDRVMSKIRRGVYETLSRARETIARRTIEQIKPAEFAWCSTGGAYTLSGAGTGYNWSGSNNTVIGNWAGYNIGSGLTIGNLKPTNNMISFHDKNEKAILIITNDGDVEWNGKPSEAADALVRTFQFKVEDMKGVTKAARRRYYLRACQNILNKAKTMPHDEFVAFLQKQVYNKERRVIIDGLKGEE